MKYEVQLFLRHLTNVNVLQKGWNYVRIKLLCRGSMHLVTEEGFPLESQNDRRSPTRFYDHENQHYTVSDAEKTILFPAIRVEYFDQEI